MTDTVNLVLIQHHQTDKAIIVSEDGDRGKAIALPLSQIEVHNEKLENHELFVEVEMPEWLALEKGLI